MGNPKTKTAHITDVREERTIQDDCNNIPQLRYQDRTPNPKLYSK